MQLVACHLFGHPAAEFRLSCLDAIWGYLGYSALSYIIILLSILALVLAKHGATVYVLEMLYAY